MPQLQPARTQAGPPVSHVAATPRPEGALSQLMTAGEVATMLLMRVSTVQDYARRGVLPSFKIGRHRRFLRSDVLAALDELRYCR